MAKIAYILLCHKDPDAVIRQARGLTAAGDFIAIHFDARAPSASYARIRAALDADPNVAFSRKRAKCGWGEWSLVQATLNTLETALEAFPNASHFYMLSGDCMPIKTAEYMHGFLDGDDADYIETVDFFTGGWIKTGLTDERLVYRHFFNERTHKRLFYASLAAQQVLGLRRRIPADIEVRIGSQWWCLRRRTIEAIIDVTRTRRDVMRFFRTSWIPDETFFQTLVPHLVPEPEIRSRTLTFLMFSDYGMPVTFYNDHYDLLLGQDFLFARKISPEARDLQARLAALYKATGVGFDISNEGRNLYAFLTGRGRVGRSFARRFWETESTIGRDRELLILTCKKWHVAKRILHRLGQQPALATLGYLFSEEDTPLPELGGIQTTLDKRNRHRRALMRMLFDYYGTDRMVICADPGSLDLMRDFFSDRCQTRMLEIECRFSDEDLIDHARRIGLAGDHSGAFDRLLPTLRNDIAHQSEQIRDAGFSDYACAHESDPPELLTDRLAAFLSISHEAAARIVGPGDLFAN